jgi:hypothetical protein
MSTFFQNFPKVFYNFGNEKEPVVFQNLNRYSELIDQYREEIGTYIEYEIRDGERPDTLSYRLYGNAEYGWTFFLMNPVLRECGWPMSLKDVYEKAATTYYKDYTAKLNITTADSCALFSDIYSVGQSVLVSGKEGIVVSKNLNVGEITISSEEDLRGSVTLSYSVDDQDITKPLTVNCSLSNTVYEYRGIHHYENDSGEWTDFFFSDEAIKIPVTNIEHLVAQNDNAKRIRVIKSDLIRDVVGKYKKIVSL